jgi:hypothetical protein
MAQKITAVAVSCGCSGLPLLSVSAHLEPAYFTARNAEAAADVIEFHVEERGIARNGFYKSSDPQANRIVGMLKSDNAATALRALAAPASGAGGTVGTAAAAAAGGDNVCVVVSTSMSIKLQLCSTDIDVLKSE